jgi:hypothetical protein
VRVVRLVLLAAVGAVTGLAAVMVHQRWWGLLLAVAAVSATAVALPPGWSTRLPFALGFVVVLGLGTAPRSEGDYLVPGNVRGYVLLALGFVLVLTAVATLPRPQRLPRMDP